MTLRTLVAAIVMLLIVGINAYLLYVEETDYYAQIVVDDEGAVVMKNEDRASCFVYSFARTTPAYYSCTAHSFKHI